MAQGVLLRDGSAPQGWPMAATIDGAIGTRWP